MKPIDFRNETFGQLRDRLTDLRLAVLQAWQAHGPATTRQVATRCGIDLLTFRPRTTELYQMGAVVLVDEAEPTGDAHEGVYRARTMAEWEAWHAAQAGQLVSGQQQLMG